METLTIHEQTELEQHEAIIQRGLKTFVEVGAALLAIRDGRLYRLEHGTFEDYCREKWQIKRSYAYEIMDAASIVKHLSMSGIPDIELPSSVSQTRALAALDPEDQPIVYQRSMESAPNGKVTAAHVQATVDEFIDAPREHPPKSYFCAVCNKIHAEWIETEHIDEDTQERVFTLSCDLCGVEYEHGEHGPMLEPDVDYKALAAEQLSTEEIQDSDEYYTPEYIITAARAVLGGIDLDPASCAIAQAVVGADHYYSKADDGLSQAWFGRVWLNPPFSKPQPFIFKLIAEYEAGAIESAIVLTNNGTETRWGQALLSRYPVCFVGASVDRGSRISFWTKHPDEPARGNRYAQMIFYVGNSPHRFTDVFAQFGTIL